MIEPTEQSAFEKSKNIPTFHEKGWGHERWIVNNEKYCGKILHFKKGKKCSWHYHKLKDETFYLQSGKLLVQLSDGDDIALAQSVELESGDSLHIYPGLRHRMTALQPSDLFEFSTQHFDSDSYRIEKGD